MSPIHAPLRTFSRLTFYTGCMIQILRPIPVASIKLLVFDLDGTLIDSAQDLCNSVNAALEAHHLPHLDDPVIASFVGNGAPLLVRRSLARAKGIPVEEVDEALQNSTHESFIRHYREHKLDSTYAYEGVLDALAALKCIHDDCHQPCRKMAVLTNKPVNPARGICEGLGMAGYFFRIYGGNSFEVKKPDPLGLSTIINEAGVTPEETVMIGDSRVDILTARNAGAWSLGCDFGFGQRTLDEHPPDILVDSPSDWTKALLPETMAS